MKHKWSCLCENIKFEINWTFDSFYLCHCKYCRKDTGSNHASNLFSKNAKIKWITWLDFIKTFNYKNTRHSINFCSNCASHMPILQDNWNTLVIPAWCLDTKIDITPNWHIFTESKASWDENLEKLPMYNKFPL